MTPGELGWFGIGPKSGNYDGLQYDEIEYLMVKSLAYNAPISLQTSFARMEAHALTPDILEIVRRYEELRFSGRVPTLICEQLKEQGRDFVLLPETMEPQDAVPRFVPVQEVAEVAGTHDVRSFVGAWREATVATLWHYLGNDGKLVLDVPRVAAYDVRGRSVAVERHGSQSRVPLDHRRLLLHFPDLPPERAREHLIHAGLEMRKPTVLWFQAETFSQHTGNMVLGSAVGLHDRESLGDVVVCDGPMDRTGRAGCFCEYRVPIPRHARWTFWARVRYPAGGDMSFGFVRPDQEVTLTGDQVLGNCGANDKGWHWTGRGGGVTTVPPGAPIVLNLDVGEFVFRIYPREGSGVTATNPRLDCFCLAEDPDFVPSDEEAAQALLP
jgi:hypothetical protein